MTIQIKESVDEMNEFIQENLHTNNNQSYQVEKLKADIERISSEHQRQMLGLNKKVDELTRLVKVLVTRSVPDANNTQDGDDEGGFDSDDAINPRDERPYAERTLPPIHDLRPDLFPNSTIYEQPINLDFIPSKSEDDVDYGARTSPRRRPKKQHNK